MHPRVRASVLWGAVAALSFLVLVQGYDLFDGLSIGFLPRLGAAVVVGAVATGVTYLVDGWLAAQAAD